MGLIPIHYDRMLQLHPWPGEGFMNLINGSIKAFHQQGPTFENTCASEISYAFNCVTEHIINTWGDYGKGGVWAKKVRTEMDVDGYEYIYSTIDLHQYLNNRYGNGEMFPNTSKIGDRNGVIIFQPADTNVMGHTDVWVNGQIDNPSLYLPDWYAKVKNDVCYFWDLSS